MSESRPGTVHLKEQMEVGSRCKTEMLKQKKSLEMLSFSQETTKMNIDSHGQELVNKIINKTPREVASKEGKRLRQVIDKFGDSMRRSKSQFHSMEKGVSKAESYFLTAVDDI